MFLKHRIAINVGRFVLFVPACLTGATIVLLLVVVLWMSFRTGLPGDANPLSLENYQKVFTDPFSYKVLLNTLIFAVVTIATVIVFAFPMALLVERTDLPFRKVFLILSQPQDPYSCLSDGDGLGSPPEP